MENNIFEGLKLHVGQQKRKVICLDERTIKALESFRRIMINCQKDRNEFYYAYGDVKRAIEKLLNYKGEQENELA